MFITGVARDVAKYRMSWFRVGKMVKPKQEKLKETEEALEKANAKLQEKQASLKEVEDRVQSAVLSLACQ